MRFLRYFSHRADMISSDNLPALESWIVLKQWLSSHRLTAPFCKGEGLIILMSGNWRVIQSEEQQRSWYKVCVNWNLDIYLTNSLNRAGISCPTVIKIKPSSSQVCELVPHWSGMPCLNYSSWKSKTQLSFLQRCFCILHIDQRKFSCWVFPLIEQTKHILISWSNIIKVILIFWYFAQLGFAQSLSKSNRTIEKNDIEKARMG